MSLSLFSPRSSLSLDLNNFIKYLKQREETHLSLIEYLQQVSLPNDSSNIFLDEELKDHNRFLTHIIGRYEEIEESERVRIEKWGESIGDHILDTDGMRLINKSLTRIMEILRGTVDRIKSHQKMYEFEYTMFQQQILKFQIKTRLGDMIDTISSYSKEKLLEDIELLKRILGVIENGERDSISQVIAERYQKVRDRIDEERGRARRVKEEEIRMKREMQREKEEERNRIEEKMKVIEERQRVFNKNKKRVMRYVEGTLAKMYSPMAEFSKGQFSEDMIYSDYQEHYDRLFKQIQDRNRPINLEIAQFVTYGAQMDQMIHSLGRKESKTGKSPRAGGMRKVSIANYNSVGSNQNTDVNNYSSIETVPELPPIRELTAVVSSISKPEPQGQQSPPSSTQTIIEKHIIFMKSLGSQKIQNLKREIENPRKEILKSKSIFESVRFPEKRKQLTQSECLPYIKVFQRTSLDTNKAKVAMHNRNIFKTAQMNYKNLRRSQTPQMLIPLIQIGVPDYVPVKGSQLSVEPAYIKRRYLKE